VFGKPWANTGAAEATTRATARMSFFMVVLLRGLGRRAKSCRGRVHLCGPRNYKLLPEGVRGFFELFLAAKHDGIAFDEFKEEMQGRRETKAFGAWRRTAGAPRQ
jgi:hypothetical protein